jgi:hypothetical protein
MKGINIMSIIGKTVKAISYWAETETNYIKNLDMRSSAYYIYAELSHDKLVRLLFIGDEEGTLLKIIEAVSKHINRSQADTLTLLASNFRAMFLYPTSSHIDPGILYKRILNFIILNCSSEYYSPSTYLAKLEVGEPTLDIPSHVIGDLTTEERIEIANRLREQGIRSVFGII